MTVIYDKVAVIGMGLIGASIALAARRGGLATTIIGSDQSPEVATAVARLQLVHSGGAGWRGWQNRRTNFASHEIGRGANRYRINQKIGCS